VATLVHHNIVRQRPTTGDDEEVSDITPKPYSELESLDPSLSLEVRAWVSELRTVWAATGLSISRFARLYKGNDKSTISRYLNGKRVPQSRWFLDTLLTHLANVGKDVRPEVREHLNLLQLRAMEVTHPHQYKVRRVSDELEIAVTRLQEAERHARNLETQLALRMRQLQEVEDRKDQFRAAWENEHTTRQAEKTRFCGEITDLARQLHGAQDRVVQAENRCQELERLLDQLDHHYSVEQDDAISNISVNNLQSVARLLVELSNMGATDHVVALAKRIATGVRMSACLDEPEALELLLNSMKSVGVREQVIIFAERIAAECPLDDTSGASLVLYALGQAALKAQFAKLAGRAAVGISLGNTYDLAMILETLVDQGAFEHAATLADRIATDYSRDNLDADKSLLYNLTFVGVTHQVAKWVEYVRTGHPSCDSEAMRVLTEILSLLTSSSTIEWLSESDASAHRFNYRQFVFLILDTLRATGSSHVPAALAEQVREWNMHLLKGVLEQSANEKVGPGKAAPTFYISDHDLRVVAANAEELSSEVRSALAEAHEGIAKLIDGMKSSGSVSELSDLRVQWRNSAEQIQIMRKELDELDAIRNLPIPANLASSRPTAISVPHHLKDRIKSLQPNVIGFLKTRASLIES